MVPSLFLSTDTGDRSAAHYARPAGIAPRWKTLALMFLLALCAVLPYTNTVFNSFVHDDTFQVLENPYLRDFSHLREIFTSSVWSFASTQHTNYYRPMMTLGYLICSKLFGLAPYGFHLFNIFLHAAIVCILFSVTNRIFLNGTIAFAASALFALHPIHTESVAWVAAVTELELTFFCLATFRLFLDLECLASKWSLWKYFGMTASFALALLSKEQAMTLPLLATIYEHFYRADRTQTTPRQKVSRYGALWLLALFYVPLRAHFLGGLAPLVKLTDLTLYQLLLSSFALVGQYLAKLLWPAHLHAFYLFQKSVSLSDGQAMFGLLGCLLAFALFCILRKHSPAACFGIVWVLITLVPVLNPQWLGTNAFTERYAYLPSVGFCWLAAVGLQSLFLQVNRARLPVWRTGGIAALCILAAVCTFRIVTRNRDWRDNIVFYSRTLAALPVVPATNELRLNLAAAHMKQGDMGAAEQELHLILQSEPNNVYALINLGAVLMNQARLVEAMEILRQAVKLAPANSSAHLNLGVDYMHLNMLDKAERELEAGLALEPKNSGAYDNLGLLYWRRGAHAQAERAFKDALSLNPWSGHVHRNLGEFYVATGRNAEAIHEYQAVLQHDPQNAAALQALRALSANWIEERKWTRE